MDMGILPRNSHAAAPNSRIRAREPFPGSDHESFGGLPDAVSRALVEAWAMLIQ